MKIKAKTNYRFRESKTGVFHISRGHGWSCGAESIKGVKGHLLREVDKFKVCKNCLKHTDAWEPVEDDMPRFVDRKLLENAQAELEKKTKDFAEACKDLNERCLKMKEERDELRDQRAGDIGNNNKLVLERACLKKENEERKEEIGALRAENEGLYGQNNELEDKLQALKARVRDKLKKHREVLQARLQETEDKYVLRSVELVDLRKATAGHTPENIATIMKTAPPAEDLEGCTFILDYAKDGDEIFTKISGWEFWIGGKVTATKFLIRKPVVEWIENDDITDEMVVKAGGRVPCQVHQRSLGWADDTLLMVSLSKTNKFICEGDNWAYCRVLKSDLEQS